jgi:hypothetical protein
MEHIGAMKQLNSLSLTDVADARNGLRHLAELHDIQVLSLDGVGVGDAELKHLKALVNLKWLDLQSTGVTEKLADELRQALPHCKIYSGPLDPG